jgi:hypothetical protein
MQVLDIFDIFYCDFRYLYLLLEWNKSLIIFKPRFFLALEGF